jgi:hypothetical protein
MPRVDRLGESPGTSPRSFDVQSRVAALVKGMPPLRAETRNGFRSRRPWTGAATHGRPPIGGRRATRISLRFNPTAKPTKSKSLSASGPTPWPAPPPGRLPRPASPVCGPWWTFPSRTRLCGILTLSPRPPSGSRWGRCSRRPRRIPAEARDAVLARIEAIPAEQVRAAHETVRALADHGLSVNPALTRYDNRSGFVFEGLTNDADPLHQQALEWFPVRNTPEETAREVVARVLSAVAGVSPSNLNPYYDAAREKVAAAALSPRPADRRLATILVDNLRRAWREQIQRSPSRQTLFPSGFSAAAGGAVRFLLGGVVDRHGGRRGGLGGGGIGRKNGDPGPSAFLRDGGRPVRRGLAGRDLPGPGILIGGCDPDGRGRREPLRLAGRRGIPY